MPIDAHRLLSAARDFHEVVAFPLPLGLPHGLYGAAATDGTRIEGIRTDARGEYALATYFGNPIDFTAYRSGWRLVGKDGPDSDARSTWKRDAETAPERLKEVTIVLVDERGRPIKGLSVWNATYFAAGKAMHSGGYRGHDTRGDHLFVDKSTDRIEFDTPPADEKWMAMKTAVDVTGADDRTIRVTVGDDHRMQPLAGTVVDPDGNPVGHAEVSLIDADPEVRNRGGGSGYLGLRTTTDPQGRFSFAVAPDTCMIQVTRASGEPGGALPGWTDLVPVDRQARNVKVQLRRGGSFRVLLPQGMGNSTAGIHAAQEGQRRDWFAPRCYFEYQADAHCLHSTVLQPGTYHLENYDRDSLETIGDLSDVRVEVKAGENATVDLRARRSARRRLRRERKCGRSSPSNTRISR